MIAWFNENQGFLTVVLSIVAIIASIIAIIISIRTAQKQNKIDLFDERWEAYKKLRSHLYPFMDIVELFEEVDKEEVNELIKEQFDSFFKLESSNNEHYDPLKQQSRLQYEKTQQVLHERTELRNLLENVECLFETYTSPESENTNSESKDTGPVSKEKNEQEIEKVEVVDKQKVNVFDTQPLQNYIKYLDIDFAHNLENNKVNIEEFSEKIEAAENSLSALREQMRINENKSPSAEFLK